MQKDSSIVHHVTINKVTGIIAVNAIDVLRGGKPIQTRTDLDCYQETGLPDVIKKHIESNEDFIKHCMGQHFSV